MKRALPLLLALAGLLICAKPVIATPQGVVQGGYDEATGRLEAGFKIMALDRVFSEDECYAHPERVADVLRSQMDIEVVVTPSLDSVQGFDLVNVIADETNCDRLVLAIRAGAKGRIFVLDSDYGPVY